MTTLPDNNLDMNLIHRELGAGSDQYCSLNDSDFRSLAGRSSGTIYMSDFRGKTTRPSSPPGPPGEYEGLREILVRGYHNEDRNFFNGGHRYYNYVTTKVEHNDGRSHGIYHYYSVEWKGYFTPFVTGNHAFWTTSDDGSYVYIDDTMVVNNGGAHGIRNRSGEIHLVAGKSYRIQVFYGSLVAPGYMRFDFYIPGYSTVYGRYENALTYWHGRGKYFTCD